MILVHLREKLVYLKMCYNRSASYLSIFNTGMLFFVFLKGIDVHFGYWNIPIFIALISCVLIVGHLDMKLGIYRTEINRGNNNNDLAKNNHKLIKEILKEVKHD